LVARAVGRGGTAASHLKRFDIDRVFHKSMAGGHPRESLEASFDIVYEENARVHLIEAELVLVAIEVMTLLPKTNPRKPLHFLKPPLWYIRLSHTRLADAILDLCGVPVNNDLRRACFYIFSQFIAPAPDKIVGLLDASSAKKASYSPSLVFEKIDEHLKTAGT
jgi:eukaryotic translation initiation factor 2-alpha kinase 4